MDLEFHQQSYNGQIDAGDYSSDEEQDEFLREEIDENNINEEEFLKDRYPPELPDLGVNVDEERAKAQEHRVIVEESKIRELILASKCATEGCNCGINPTSITVHYKLAAGFFKYKCTAHHEGKWETCNWHASKTMTSLMIVIACLVSGATWSVVEMLFRFMNVEVCSAHFFYSYQLVAGVGVSKYYDKAQEKVHSRFADKELVAITDARYCTSWGHCASKSTACMMEYDTKMILICNCCDKREVDRNSQRMEGELLKRNWQELKDKNLKVKEVVSDASSTVTKFIDAEPDVDLSRDVWHKTKNLRSKLKEEEKLNPSIRFWEKPVISHFWWACSLVAKGIFTFPVNKLRDLWSGYLPHSTNQHDWSIENCHHTGPVVPPPGTDWLDKKSPTYASLRKVILNQDTMSELKYFVKCRESWPLENFYSHTYLRYTSKRLRFSIDNYKIRAKLAVLDHNYHTERPVAGKNYPLLNSFISRRTKNWVAYQRLSAKTYGYVPDLIAMCLREVYFSHPDEVRANSLERELRLKEPTRYGTKRTLEIYNSMSKRTASASSETSSTA